MKFRRLDPKQVPLVVVMAVGFLGLIGWTVMSLGASEPKKTAQAKKQEPPKTASASAATQPAALPPLPGPVYKADPFRPGKPRGAEKVAPPPPGGPRPSPGQPSRRPPRSGPELPDPWRDAYLPPERLRPPTRDPGRGPLQPELARPDVLVTGVIDASDGADMAIVAVADEQRLIQVGEVLVNDYKVKRIDLDGIWLVKGKDEFFAKLGMKTGEASASAPAG